MLSLPSIAISLPECNFPLSLGFLRVLAPKMTDSEKICPLFPAMCPTSCCSQQCTSSGVSASCPTDLPNDPQSLCLLQVSTLLLTHFPTVRVIPSLHVPVDSNFALIFTGYRTTSVPRCKDSSEPCSCIEIPCTRNLQQQKREMPVLSKPVLMLRIIPGYLYSASLPFFQDTHFHLSSTAISISSDK